ncbi:MAG TPA: hypothetical protein VGI95_10625 [Caulobacteraceae bacterium]
MCGVAVFGVGYRRIEAVASFLQEAANLCGLLEEMKWAAYQPRINERERPILPKSFAKLAIGELKGAKDAAWAVLRGSRSADGADLGAVLFGGQGRVAQIPQPQPFPSFDADFIFPLAERPTVTAKTLFRLAHEILEPEYGYYFIRDELCAPNMYNEGGHAPLDYGSLDDEDAAEIAQWRDYVSSAGLWTGEQPQLRDLFEINLLSERHLAVPTERLGLLGDWIVSGAGRGRLEGIGEGRALWVLTDAEMYETRPVLSRAGLLKSARPRYYRDLPIEQQRPDPGLVRRRLTLQ